MIKPAFVDPGEGLDTLGRVFGTPVVVKGRTWLPVIEGLLWGIMTRLARRRKPGRASHEAALVGLVTMIIAAGTEWCHNFAHAAAAWWVGKPMDAIRIFWGTPLVVYFDIEDPTVTPREHIIRALGGPIFNLLAIIPLFFGRLVTRSTSLARELVDVALVANLFILLVGLLPIPGIDGGPILKWSLVSKGHPPRAADQIVRQVDGALAVGLAGAAGLAAARKKWLVGIFFSLLGGLAFAFSRGWIQEQASSQS